MGEEDGSVGKRWGVGWGGGSSQRGKRVLIWAMPGPSHCRASSGLSPPGQHFVFCFPKLELQAGQGGQGLGRLLGHEKAGQGGSKQQAGTLRKQRSSSFPALLLSD